MSILLRRRILLAIGGEAPTPPTPPTPPEPPTPGSYTPDDYVQSGLIAMYDGEWNGGRETHLSSLSVWKDLIGSKDLTVTTGVTVGSNYLKNSDYSKSIASHANLISTALTMEIAFKLDDAQTTATTFILANRIGNAYYGGNFHLNYGSFGKLYVESSGDNKHGVPFAVSDRDFHTISAAWENNNSHPSYIYDNALSAMASDSGGLGRDGASNHLVIGGLYPYNTVYGMNGKVYCVRFYNRKLTASEIQQNQNIDLSRFA